PGKGKERTAVAGPGGRQKMARVCRRQQCSVERRGFRQELDSWRHKLIHCVGFESILEGLFGPALLKDLSLFKGIQNFFLVFQNHPGDI
uniref:Uncharacterized protein n=1 Tax=Rhinolophus ferrumequinum TaxID=59479 RepID=A0A671F1L9_RHIFE